jgi:hypothetical protein
MKNVELRLEGDYIVITPTRHEKLEGWGRSNNDGIEDVYVRSDASPAEIGAAIRLAFSRCT